MTRQTPPRNLPASVPQRLSNVSRETGDEFGIVLTRYALERLLYRLCQSAHRDQFVLKGAMLFHVWSDSPHRPTHDLDLLGRGNNGVARCEEIFRELCQQPVAADGLEFRGDSVKGGRIKGAHEYGGVRITLVAALGDARIPVQVDVGFGDAVVPGPVELAFPSLLGFPAPVLRAYPRETVVAEKTEAMVALGLPNTRMKDFYDLWVLARDFPFHGPTLRDALAATFTRRGTAPPEGVPVALTPAFHAHPAKQAQWAAFLRRGRFAHGLALASVTAALGDFLLPPLRAVSTGDAFESVREPSGRWTALPVLAEPSPN